MIIECEIFENKALIITNIERHCFSDTHDLIYKLYCLLIPFLL